MSNLLEYCKYSSTRVFRVVEKLELRKSMSFLFIERVLEVRNTRGYYQKRVNRVTQFHSRFDSIFSYSIGHWLKLDLQTENYRRSKIIDYCSCYLIFSIENLII